MAFVKECAEKSSTGKQEELEHMEIVPQFRMLFSKSKTIAKTQKSRGANMLKKQKVVKKTRKEVLLMEENANLVEINNRLLEQKDDLNEQNIIQSNEIFQLEQVRARQEEAIAAGALNSDGSVPAEREENTFSEIPGVEVNADMEGEG